RGPYGGVAGADRRRPAHSGEHAPGRGIRFSSLWRLLMSAFIVSGGSLLEIGCPSALSRNTEQQVSFTRTLGGKRKGFIRKGGRRAWSVDASVARPGEVSTLEAVARGLGPVGWYPPEAVMGNLLSPQASGF